MKARIALAVGVAAFLAAALAFPGQAAFAATINADITPGALNKTTDAYSPNPIEAAAGDTVVWTNKDSTLHTVTSTVDNGVTFGNDASGNPIYIPPNQTFEHTFDAEGEFDYYCTLHPAMVGTVVVGAGGGNGDNGEPSESSVETELDGQTYTVTAMSADISVTEAHIIAGQSVQVEFDGPGEVELTLPKAMISGSLMVDGAAAEVVNEDDQSTTISLTVPERGSVEITGATVVPEFGVIAALVLAVSLVAVIGFARFKGAAFGLGRL